MARVKIITYLLLLLAFLGAVALTGQKVILAQATPQLSSRFIEQPVPVTDPSSPLWERASAMDIPLTAQRVIAPSLLEPSVSSVKVRALNDGAWIAFLMEWDDPTRDVSAVRPDQFRDAAALQFPVNKDVPGACMGVRGQIVNLWHWKADWQEDLDKGFQDVTTAYPNFYKDYYPFVVGEPPFNLAKDFNHSAAKTYLTGWAAGNVLSDPLRVTPVEAAHANGFGTFTTLEMQHVLGRGVWQGGKWRVTFARPLYTGAPEESQFKAGDKTSVAFAIWNGSKGDVGAKKQLSADTTLLIEGPPVRATPAAAGETKAESAPSQKPGGFTLTIALVTGVIAGVIAGIVIAMYIFMKPKAGKSQ